jgi:hypothetical protein
LTFAIVDGSNNMGSIYIINTKWWSDFQFFILKADNVKLIHEVSQLNGNIEELEQYGRRTSLRFHNVPMVQGDLQKTDQPSFFAKIRPSKVQNEWIFLSRFCVLSSLTIN